MNRVWDLVEVRGKIAKAKAARALGRRLRVGKPASFRQSVGVHQGYGSTWRGAETTR